MRRASLMLTALGLGHMRPASGTWGSTPPPALVLLLVWLLGMNGLSNTDGWIINGVLVVVMLVFSYACVAWGDWAEAQWGKKDPGQVVADEVAGQCVALLALPWKAMVDLQSLMVNIALAGTAFIMFRLFDIIKPPPANGLQRLPGGWGILIDDLFAGVYALIATQLIALYVWPLVFAE